MCSTSYASLSEGATTDALTEALTVAYAGRPFVRVLAPGGMADSKRVRGTNVIELQAVADAHGDRGRDRCVGQPREVRPVRRSRT